MGGLKFYALLPNLNKNDNAKIKYEETDSFLCCRGVGNNSIC